MRLLFGIATFLLASCTAMPTETAAPRFLALGDSYTIGENVTEEERWPVQLARGLRERGVAAGNPQLVARTGWTTDELNAAIDSASPQGPFALVTLLIGVNNQYRGRSADDDRPEFAALIQRAIGFAGGDASRVIVVSIPDWGVTPFAEGRERERIAREIDRYNRVQEEEAARLGVRFVEITTLSRRAAGDPSLTAHDGLHPSAAMYALWTERILPVAEKILQKPLGLPTRKR